MHNFHTIKLKRHRPPGFGQERIVDRWRSGSVGLYHFARLRQFEKRALCLDHALPRARALLLQGAAAKARGARTLQPEHVLPELSNFQEEA